MTSASDHETVADAIEALPAGVRAQLALGPMEEPECRICTVLVPLAEGNEDALWLVEFHDLGNEELAEAARGALGTDRRLTTREREGAFGYRRKLERLPKRHVARVTVESLAAGVMWWRCLYVYVVAGWRP